MHLFVAIALLIPCFSWASTKEEVCAGKVKKYGLELARLEPEGVGVEYCTDIVENCVRPLELADTYPDGSKRFAITHEFGGAYPNFNVFFISVDTICQIQKIEIMRH